MFNPRQRSNKMSHVRRSAHGRKSRLIGIITQAEQSYVTITIRGEPSREFRAFRSDLDDRRIRDHLDDDCPRQLIGRRVGFVPADRQVEWPPNSGRRHLHAREVRLAHSS